MIIAIQIWKYKKVRYLQYIKIKIVFDLCMRWLMCVLLLLSYNLIKQDI